MYIDNKKCHQHSYEFQNLMSSWGLGSTFSNLQQVVDFSIIGTKSSHVQFVIFENWVFFFFIRQCTYNAASGSSATSLTRSAKREFILQFETLDLGYFLVFSLRLSNEAN